MVGGCSCLLSTFDGSCRHHHLKVFAVVSLQTSKCCRFVVSCVAKVSGDSRNSLGCSLWMESEREKKTTTSISHVPDLRRCWVAGSIHLSVSKRPAQGQDERGVVPDSHIFRLINGALDLRPALQLYLDTVMNWSGLYHFFFFQLCHNSRWAKAITHVGYATCCL